MFSAKDYIKPLIFMGRKLLSEAKIKVGKMAIFDHKVKILPFETIFRKKDDFIFRIAQINRLTSNCNKNHKISLSKRTMQ